MVKTTRDLKIMKTELIITTLVFLAKFSLLLILIHQSITKYGEMGMLVAAFMIVSVRLSPPRITYKYELMED